MVIEVDGRDVTPPVPPEAVTSDLSTSALFLFIKIAHAAVPVATGVPEAALLSCIDPPEAAAKEGLARISSTRRVSEAVRILSRPPVLVVPESTWLATVVQIAFLVVGEWVITGIGNF